ncbi:hypothetical protein FRC07_006758 [Ceratobasidium sp. 392]|nr:hypothetical protein FRC07_006758 [Ceratobasidium sp. 392]
MPKYSKKSEDDIDMTFVIQQPNKSYKCSVCPMFAEVSTLSHIRKHNLSKNHKKHVGYNHCRELESQDMSEQPTPTLPDQPMDIGESLVGPPYEDVEETSADESVSSASSSTTRPLPPPLPLGQPPLPTYNFFNDYVYQEFDDDPVTAETIGYDSQSMSRSGLINAHTTDNMNLKPPNYPPPASVLWQPFPDKEHFLTYSLFNSSHVRFSRSQQEAILDWAREMGMSPVPTLYSLQSCQEELLKLSGTPPRMFKTDSGHIYYANSIGDMLKQDFSNPHPGAVQYRFANVCVEQPLSAFLQDCIQLHASFPNGLHVVDDGHALREKAQGRPIYCVPFVVFVDDVSGNVSKQWNKHWCCYLSNASLPRAEMNKRMNIRFMSTTQHASAMEMLHGICEVFKESFDEPVLVYDIEQQREVLACPYVFVVAGDNPMQAAECSHTGLNSNMLCRTCMAGGTTKHKASDSGYSNFFKPSVLRNVAQTIDNVDQQYEIVFTATNVDTLTNQQRQTGIKDAIAQPQLEKIIKERQSPQKTGKSMPEISKILRESFLQRNLQLKMNPLLTMPAVYVMEKSKTFEIFSARLRSLSTYGLLSSPVPNYIFTNRGSLNGKHLKVLGQTMAFCISDLVSRDLYDCWRTIGRLMVLLWYSTIDDLDAYNAELTIAIDDFLHTLAKCSPRLIADKGKIHLLVHMPLFTARFGPLVGCNTERYESFNSSFRQCSVLSNRQAPSRDIAKSFQIFDQARHLALGGYYYDKSLRKFSQAGEGVLELGRYSRFMSRVLGIKQDSTDPVPGAVTVRQAAQRVTWEASKSSSAPRPTYLGPTCTMKAAAEIVSQCGDRVSPESHVVYEDSESNCCLGQIHEILVPLDKQPACVTLYAFAWGSIDPSTCLPVVQREQSLLTAPLPCIGGTRVVQQERQTSGATVRTILHNEDQLFLVNVFLLHNHKFIARLVDHHLPSFLHLCLQTPSDYESIRLWAAQEYRKPKGSETRGADTVLRVEDAAQSSSKAKAGKSASKSKRKGKQKETPVDNRADTQAGASTSSPATQHEGAHISKYRSSSMLDDMDDREQNQPNPAGVEDNLIDPNLHGQQANENPRRRRRRDSNSEDKEERLMRLSEFAEGSMNRHSLLGDKRDLIQKFARLDTQEMLIELLVVHESKDQRASSTATRDFLKKPAYTKTVVNCLKVGLLAPRLTFYVTPLQEWILSDIQIEVATAATENWDINKLMNRLAPNQMVISEEHRARWAFIAKCHGTFMTGCALGEENTRQFWDHVDKQLAELKREIQSRPNATTPAIRQRMLTGLFSTVLAEHRAQFPTKSPAGALGNRPSWQQTLETEMDMGANV